MIIFRSIYIYSEYNKYDGLSFSLNTSVLLAFDLHVWWFMSNAVIVQFLVA